MTRQDDHFDPAGWAFDHLVELWFGAAAVVFISMIITGWPL